MLDRLYVEQRNWGARIHETTVQGIRAIVLENERLRLTLLAGKGSDLVELNYKPLDLDFVWLAPGGVRDPNRFAATGADSKAEFRENYPGGWQEILPNGGLPSSHDGAEHGLHGDLYNVPWDVAVIEDSPDAVAVRFSVHARKSPLRLDKTVRLVCDEAGFRFDERLRNLSAVPVRAMWGHHITFGPPFLEPGSVISVPDGITVTPQAAPIGAAGRRLATMTPFPWPLDPANGVDLSVVPERGTPSDQAYLSGFDPDGAWYEVRRQTDGIGARIEWDGRAMPFLWFWQEFGAPAGYPWYGRNDTVGLEPFSSFPNLGIAEAVGNGTALTLAPHAELAFWLRMAVVGGVGP